jgi:N-methylhydantoinase B
MCYQDSIELDELRQPLFVETRKLVPDTEGAGAQRGAPSAHSVFGPTAEPMCVAYVSDGNINPALGTRSGLPGGRSNQRKRLADGREIQIPACAEIWLAPGEMVVSISAGGGGYGDPRRRDLSQVVHDVREGWISRERARNVYGVALSSDGELDAEATEVLRG